MIPIPSVVLIVDDDPMIHVIGEAIFRKLGSTSILKADNGAHGLQVLQQREAEIDLVVCDLNMPDVDGLQFLRLLMERRCEKPIIIASGEDNDIVRAAYNLAATHNLNIIGRVEKPMQASAIKDILEFAVIKRSTTQVQSTPAVTERDLRAALSMNEIAAYFQPKIDLQTGAVIGAEALARWMHPQIGIISPVFFVPIAERAKLIGKLTSSILDQSLAVASDARAKGLSLSMAVNTDAHTVTQLSFPDDISQQVRNAGLDNDCITIEVTERGLLEDGASAIEVLTRLRMMRYGISIDDFGTGNSNIKQLCTFPFTELKIDKSFLDDVETDRTKAVCLNAIVSLARSLNLTTVAEGIETLRDLSLMRRSGVDYAQGYYIARPMTAADFLDWVLTMNPSDFAGPVSLSADERLPLSA